jgi:quercetin dioxygenase-like cupin family protein
MKPGAHMIKLNYFKVLLIIASLCISLSISSTEISVIFSQDLPDIPGKTGDILIVEYAPGESSATHRHNANTFVYVLEGSVIMQVEGGVIVTLHEGETFYENPDDIHSVSKNASETDPAKILVFFVKDTGVPASIPVP